MISVVASRFISRCAKKTNNFVKGLVTSSVKSNVQAGNIVPLACDTVMLPKNQLYKKLLDFGMSENKIKILLRCDDPKIVLEELKMFSGDKKAIDDYVKTKILDYKKACETFGRELNLGGTNQKHLAVFENDISIDIMDLSAKHRAMKMFSAGKLKVKQLPEEMVLSSDDIKVKQILDDKFKEIAGTNFEMFQYRGEKFSPNMPHLHTLKNLKQGDVFELPGYAWTTDSSAYAFGNYASASANNYIPVKYSILCPNGTKILTSRSRLGQEYVLPCDSKFKLIKKVVNKDGAIEIFCEHIPATI